MIDANTTSNKESLSYATGCDAMRLSQSISKILWNNHSRDRN